MSEVEQFFRVEQVADYAARMRKERDETNGLLAEVVEFFAGDRHEPFDSVRLGRRVCRSDEADWPCLVERLRQHSELRTHDTPTNPRDERTHRD